MSAKKIEIFNSRIYIYFLNIRKKKKKKKKENLPIAPSSRQTLQQRPGNKTGSSQFGFGHSFLMFRHSVRPAILRFFCTCQSANNNNNKIRKENENKEKKNKNIILQEKSSKNNGGLYGAGVGNRIHHVCRFPRERPAPTVTTGKHLL